MYVIWNKLFKREFILTNNIQFVDFLSGEDRLFNTHSFKYVNRFAFINKPFYRYFLRGQESLANKYVENRFQASLTCHKELIIAYKKMGLYTKENKSSIDFIFIKGVMSCITQLNSKGCKLRYKQKKHEILNLLSNDLVKDALNSIDIGFSYSKIVIKILKTNNAALIYFMGKSIFILQFKLNKVYLKIKHKLK